MIDVLSMAGGEVEAQGFSGDWNPKKSFSKTGVDRQLQCPERLRISQTHNN